MKKEEQGEARVMALRGSLSRYVKDLEMQPGWHQLPNGIVAYSDPVAMSLTDPRGQIESTSLVKENDGMWSQVENVDDFTNLGETAFRKIGAGGPQRTITFFAPSTMEDYWEHESEVPVRPFAEEKRREPQGRTDWSEDDKEDEEQMELQMESHDIEKMVVAQRPNEVELDETIYTEKMSVKDLQIACKERQLPYSGSKRRQQERKPLALGQPRLSSLKEQETHFVTHLPYAPWCQACVATRAKEDKHEMRDDKPDQGKNVI